MFIGVATLQLDLPPGDSLKARRRILKSLITRLRNQFNIAVAEIGELETRDRATIAIVTVANDATYVQSLLQQAVNFVAELRLDCELADVHIEVI